MGVLKWSPRAADDLEEICLYLERSSPEYAAVFAQRVMEIIESLPENPLLGAMVPEVQDPALRERHFQNYRIVYRWDGKVVRLVTITHAARMLNIDS